MSLGQKATARTLAAAWLSGFTITLGNPKTMAFYLAILPLMLAVDAISMRLWAMLLVPLTIAVLLAVGSVFILAALRVRHWLTSTVAQQWLFRSAAVIMLLTAIAMVAKTL